MPNGDPPTGFEDDRDHAPIDSEIFALLDSIGASWIVKNGIVTVVTKYGDTWNFTVPEELNVGSAYKALFQVPASEAHLVKRKNPQT